MRFHYDQKKDAFAIRFAENAYAESDEVDDGVIFDFDRKGKLIGIEILNASRKLTPTFKAALKRKEIPLSLGIPA